MAEAVAIAPHVIEKRKTRARMEPSRPPVSCTYVRRLFSGRTFFLGPKTGQSLLHLVVIRPAARANAASGAWL
jgi:hypothetical protein